MFRVFGGFECSEFMVWPVDILLSGSGAGA